MTRQKSISRRGSFAERAARSFMVFILLCAVVGVACAAEHKVDISELNKDFMKTISNDKEAVLVQWYSAEYFRALFERDKTVPASEVEGFLRMMRPYVVLSVMDAKIVRQNGQPAGMTFRSERDIRQSLHIVDKYGRRYRPIKEENLSPQLREWLKGARSQPAGDAQVKRNMHYFVLPAKNNKDRRFADPKAEGTLTVKWESRTFKWRLPFGSLVPAKFCRKCQEELSGAYRFCPWCGMRLTAKPKQQ